MRVTTFLPTILLLLATGCRSPQAGRTVETDSVRPSTPVRAQGLPLTAEAPGPLKVPVGEFREVDPQHLSSAIGSDRGTARPRLKIVPVAHTQSSDEGTVTIDGRRYRISLVEMDRSGTDGPAVQFATSRQVTPPGQLGSDDAPTSATRNAALPVESQPDALLINLPTALSLISGDHPAVGLARWRVQEAYARVDQADALWLPSLQAGLSFHRHDGNYQASNGSIVDVNRSSFQYGLGAGATGAGTTPRPGLRAQFHLADALFEPEIARRTAWANGHAEQAVVNRQMLSVAVAYTELLNARQQQRIVEQSRARVATIAQLTADFAAAGQGLQADADRMDTELTLIDARLVGNRETVELASSRMAHALSADPSRRIVPMDVALVPLELQTSLHDRAAAIQTGLRMRPELKEAQALVSAACQRYQQQKTAPLVPSLLLGFSAGEFGGGVGSTLDSIDGRYDLDAVMTWEVRNLGFGERAARRSAESRVQQAMFEKLQRMDDVAREVSDAFTQIHFRRERMLVTQRAIETAQNSYSRNLDRIRDGQGLPLEVLQSVQALEDAQRAYAESVAAFNTAQFQLQWALGWRVSAPDSP